MNAANNHPSVQNAKETVMNGEVRTVERNYSLRTAADMIQLPEIVRTRHIAKVYRSRCTERQG
jgi:hypothetical protein